MKKQEEIRKIHLHQLEIIEAIIDSCKEFGAKKGYVKLDDLNVVTDYLYQFATNWKLLPKQTVWQAVNRQIQQVEEYPEFVHTNGVNLKEARQAVYQRIFGPDGNYERYEQSLAILKNKATTYYALIKAPNHPVCKELLEENCLEVTDREMSYQTFQRLVYPFLKTVQKGDHIQQTASTMEGYRHPVLAPSRDYGGDVLSFNPDISQKHCESSFLLDETSIDVTPFKKKTLQTKDSMLEKTRKK